MEVHIESSKTDQYWKSDWVLIACFGIYCQVGEITASSPERLFCGIIRTKAGEKLQKSGAISYTKLWKLVKQKLKQLGYTLNYELHSFRSGRATAAHVPFSITGNGSQRMQRMTTLRICCWFLGSLISNCYIYTCRSMGPFFAFLVC